MRKAAEYVTTLVLAIVISTTITMAGLTAIKVLAAESPQGIGNQGEGDKGASSPAHCIEIVMIGGLVIVYDICKQQIISVST